MFARTFAVLSIGACLAFTAAACSSGSTASAPAAPVAAPTTAAAVTPTATATAAAPVVTATTKPIKVAPVAASSCPSSVTLLSARVRTTGHQQPAGTKETRIACHDGWAMAANEPAGQESEVDTFHYVSGKWVFLGGSSGQTCEIPPAAVKKSLAAQGWSDCAA